MKVTFVDKETRVMPTKRRCSPTETTADIHVISADSHTEDVDDGNDGNDFEEYDGDNVGSDLVEHDGQAQNKASSRSPLKAGCDHFQRNGSNIGCSQDSRPSQLRRFPSASTRISLPIANPFMTHTRQVLLSRSRNHRFSQIKLMDTNHNRSYSPDANKNVDFSEPGESNRQTRSGWKRVRFRDGNSLIGEDTLKQTHNEKRRRLMEDDNTEHGNITSSLQLSPKHISFIPRSLPSSPTVTVKSIAPSCKPIAPPQPLLLPSYLKVPSFHHSLSPKTSHISTVFNIAHHWHCAIAQQFAVVSSSTTSEPLHRIYSTNNISNRGNETFQIEVESYQSAQSVPSEENSATPNVVEVPTHNINRRNHGREHISWNIVENYRNEGSTNNAMLKARTEDRHLQSMILDLTSQMNMEKESLPKRNEEYLQAKQLVNMAKQRIEIDMQRLDMEENDRRRRREAERSSLKKEERSLMRMYEMKKHCYKKMHDLETEQLDIKGKEFARLAQERHARRDINECEMEWHHDSQRRASAEYREDSEAMRRLFAMMNDARPQLDAASKIDDFRRIFISRNS